MLPDRDQLRPHLQSFDFEKLFMEGLGWDRYTTDPVNIRVDNVDYSLTPVAQKAGFGVYQCSPGPDGAIPAYTVRRKIDGEVAKRTFEHLVVFVDQAKTVQVWQWVKLDCPQWAALVQGFQWFVLGSSLQNREFAKKCRKHWREAKNAVSNAVDCCVV